MSETLSMETFNLLLTKIETLQATVEQQQSELNQLKSSHSTASPQSPNSESKHSRRKLLKRLAVAAAGAATVTTALATTGGDASAATGSTASVGLYGYPGAAGVVGLPTGSVGLAGSSSNNFNFAFSLTAGVFGISPNGTGVYGVSTTQNGVTGSSTSSNGVSGGSQTGYGGTFSGGTAPLFLIRNSGIGAPTTGSHQLGELYVDDVPIDTGNLYFCTASGTPGTWVRLSNSLVAGANISLTANANGTTTIAASSSGGSASGTVTFLSSAVRIAATNGTVAPENKAKLIASGATPNAANPSTVQIQVTGVGGIPAGAKGIVGVLTNIGATAGGNLRFWTGATVPNTVNLNVPGALPSLNLSASFSIPIDATGKVFLGYGTGAAGAQCGYAVDVTGYIL